MEGDVVGLHLPGPAEALVELVEVGPGVAVVGAEAGEVDVGEEEDVVDDEAGVAAGVTGRCIASIVTPPPRSNTWPSSKPWASGRAL